MTIKQYGGVFGRNPTFNNVTIEGTLTFDGDIDINSDLTISGNLYLPDNSKAIFGDNDDLQIYHDGSNSYISEQGTGDLRVYAQDFQIRNADGSNTMLYANAPTGGIQLFHTGEEKLATTATGIDVTGSVTADGLTVDGSLGQIALQSSGAELHFSRNGNNDLLANGGSSAALTIGANDNVRFLTGGSERLRINSSGQVSIGSSFASGVATRVLTVDDPSNAAIVVAHNGATALNLYADADEANIGSYLQGANMKFFTTPSGGSTTERMRIDSSGNVGIGTSSPVRPLSVKASQEQLTLSEGDARGATFDYRSSTGNLNIATNGTNARTNPQFTLDLSGNVLVGRTASLTGQSESISSDTVMSVHGVLTQHQTNAGILQYSTIDNSFQLRAYGATAGTGIIKFLVGGGGGGADSEAMRIDSSGNLLVGATSARTGTNSLTFEPLNSFFMMRAAGTGTISQVAFVRDTAGTPVQVGDIATTGTATAYNTSSDQRLKENITDANDAGDKIDAIKVRQYDWKADGSHQDYGMVAQELMTVAPEAVSGDPESDEMMGVDYSKLVPMMLKEIQSLRARVAALES